MGAGWKFANWTRAGVRGTMGCMSASDAAPLPRLGEVYFDVRGDSRSMRLSWYADTGVAVFSIWQGGTCTGTFRLPITDLPRMVEALQQGPRGAAGEPAHEDPPAREAGRAGAARGPRPAVLDDDVETGQQTAAMRPPGQVAEPATGLVPAADQADSLTTRPTPAGRYRGDSAPSYDPAGYDGPATGYGEPATGYGEPARYDEPAARYDDPAGGYGEPSGGFPAMRAARQQDELGGPDPLGARGGRHSGRSRGQVPPEGYQDDAPGRRGAPAGHPEMAGYDDESPRGYGDDPLGYGGAPGTGGGPPIGYGEEPPARYSEEPPVHYGEEPPVHYREDLPAEYRDEPPSGRHGGRGVGRHGGGAPAGYDDEPAGGYLDEPAGGYLDEPDDFGTGLPGQDLPRHSLPGRGRHGAGGPAGYDEDPGMPGEEDDPAPESFPYGAPPAGRGPRPRGRYPDGR
jgi:hypothetical protein